MQTRILAEFIEQTGYEQIPAKAIETARLAFLDCLGVALAGSLDEAPRKVVEFVRDLGGKPEATIIGTSIKSSSPLAALANGTASHVLDYDDTIKSLIGHPSVVLVSTVLAVSERCKSSGKEALAAYILGLEIGGRLGSLCGPDHFNLGWHNTSTLGSIAAAVAAGKLLKLDKGSMAAAIGIAAAESSGLRKNFGTMTKSFQAGHAAMNGVIAGLLASNGFTAGEDILEGDLGLCNLLSGGKEYDYSALVSGLGSSWNTISPGITFKPYPSCRGTHPAIDAALYLKNEYGISSGDIAHVDCIVSRFEAGILQYHEPRTGLEGKFSLEYCVAVALHEGEVAMKHFTPQVVLSDEIQKLTHKVTCVYPPEIPNELRQPMEVVVKLQNGKTFSKKVEVADTKGDPSNPMANEELVAKYRECAALVLPPEKVETTLGLITGLDSLKDLSSLTGLLSPG
ncbi:MmgE/PrpD family protein [Chloroflexota bacterium]